MAALQTTRHTRATNHRTVQNPIEDTTKTFTVANCGFDPDRQAVQLFLEEPTTTKKAVFLTGARFEHFLQCKKDADVDYTISEGLLQKYYKSYLWVLSNSKGCVYNLGSFFPVISSTKKFIYLKYVIDLGDCPELNQIIKKECEKHKPTKKATFEFEKIKQYVKHLGQDPGDRQESLIALINLFGLGHSVEVSMLKSSNVQFNDDGSIELVLQHCAKSKQFKKTKVHVPPVGLFNVAKELKNHMECTSKLGSRLWWKWSNGRFSAQHIGKSRITKIAKKIARFLKKDPEEYASHSFCCFEATSMVEGGATTNQLLVSGGWSNEGIAHGYIEQSSHAACQRS